MKRILVVNVNWLGDVIFSIPVFKALKKTYPQAKISCLAVPRVKEVLEIIPEIDEIIIYDEKGRDRWLGGKLRLVRELRVQQFDAAFLLHRSLTRALLVYLAGIPQRIGYDAKGRGFLLTHKVKPLPGRVHRSDHYLNVVESFGVSAQDRSCSLVAGAAEQKKIEDLLKKEGVNPSDFLAVVNCGGNWHLKRWSKESFAQLINRLVTKFQAKVVLPGGEQDRALAAEVSQRSGVKTVILAGQTNFKELAALMKRANVVISSDSGPLHIASGVGTNVIGLFGPTRPEVTGPRGPGKFFLLQKDVGCNQEPCYNLTCPDNVCMRSITVDEVLSVVGQIKG